MRPTESPAPCPSQNYKPGGKCAVFKKSSHKQYIRYFRKTTES